METNDIDKTHIIVLQELNGLLKKIELPINRPETFINELKAMIKNPSRTVWDMQSLFTSRYPMTNRYLDYIHPFSYQDTYVQGISYPHMAKYDDLQKSWADAKNMAHKCCPDYGNQNETMRAALILQTEFRLVNNLKTVQKDEFFREAIRWINGNCYHDAVNKITQEASVKMFSTENIGWNNFPYEINNDVKISVKTNFGYGSSSYFTLAVQYKGLDILPYSYIVKYYKANMADIIRCTRSYMACRESWLASFDFVSDFVNKSVEDPDGFVESYIMQEVTEMMTGLEAIATDPEVYIGKIRKNKADPFVIYIRPMLNNEEKRLQSYPDEMPMLFKVEKITGALDFLNSLTAIAKIVNKVQPYIDRLLDINTALYPEIQEAMKRITNRINENKPIKENLEKLISDLSNKIKSFETEIESLCTETAQDKHFIQSKYETEHPEYLKAKEELNDLKTQHFNVDLLIYDLNSFLDILNNSLSKLDKLKHNEKIA